MPSLKIYKKRYTRKQIAKNRAEADAMAIKAQESLIELGYADKLPPLRLRSQYSNIAIGFAIIAALLYGLSGIFYGYSLDMASKVKFFPELDSLSLAALIGGIACVIFSFLALQQKWRSKVQPVSALIILVAGSLICHIFSVVIGVLAP